jgi:hypothetical protein
MVIVNNIDTTTGRILYAETLKGPGSVNESGTLASVHFTVIGEYGGMSTLNLSDVIIVNPDTMPYNPIEVVNASVRICDLVYPSISIEPEGQFDVNITVNPKGLHIYAVQYELTYNTSVLRAVTQEKRAFLGTPEATIEVTNEIGDGKLVYAETLKGPGAAKEPGVLTSIRFMPIGNRGGISDLNLSDVIIVNPENRPYKTIELINATVTLNNTTRVSVLTTRHRINNAGTCAVCLSACEPYDPNALEPVGKDSGRGNITRIRWVFGDGQSEIREGCFDEIRYIEHKYSSWNWLGGVNEHYVPFNASVTITDSGGPEFCDSSCLNITVYMPGDTNGDGKVNIHDAVLAGRYFGKSSSQHEACGDYNWCNAETDGTDLNNDGVVNIQDTVIIGTNWGHSAWQ